MKSFFSKVIIFSIIAITVFGLSKGGALPKRSGVSRNSPLYNVVQTVKGEGRGIKNDFEYVDDETQKTISRYIVSTDDIIISIVGTIGLTAIVNESLNNANLTENCVKLTNIKNATPEYILLFLKSEIGQNEIMRGTVGAVQLKLPIKNIQSIKIDLLPLEAMTDLDKVLKPIFHSISANIEENQRLAALRDTLLPKLMNGEIDVSAVKI